MYNIIDLSFEINSDVELTIPQEQEIADRVLQLAPEIAKWLKQQIFLEFPYAKYTVDTSE